MNKRVIINKVKSLNLPIGSYIVFGSCPMAVAGIREAGDIDFLVSEHLFNELKNSGWKQIEKSPNDKPLVKDDFEAHANWNFSSYQPTLKHLLETADIIENIPFASIYEVLKWKTSSGRPKDLVDLELINRFLDQSKGLELRL